MTKKGILARRGIIHVDDGEWVTISWTDQHEQCCNCGLRHTVDYRVKKGELQFKARRIEDRRKQ